MISRGSDTYPEKLEQAGTIVVDPGVPDRIFERALLSNQVVVQVHRE